MESEDGRVVIVVRYNGEIRWFRSERDLWILDVNKWREDYLGHGHEVPDFNDSYRFGIRVIDHNSLDSFLEKMSMYEVSKYELSVDLARRFPSAESWWDVQDLFPVAFFDFDRKRVGGFYPDGVPIERYVPDGWVGEFIDFANEYPENVFPRTEKFWIKEDADLLALLNQRGQ